MLAVVRHHTWLAAIAFVVVFAGAATVAMSLPDVYRATATELVEHPGTTEGGLPAGLLLLARHALSARQIPRSARNLA